MSTVLRCVRSVSIGTAATNIGSYTAPSVTTGVVVSGLLLVNRTASTIAVSCTMSPSGASLCVGTSIIPGGSLVLADEGHRLVLNSGDQITVQSNTAASVDAIMSVAEIT